MNLIMLPILVLSATLSEARDTGVRCQLRSFTQCSDCEKRIPVSCADREYVGSVDLSTKPTEIEWLIVNSKNGTEKLISIPNKSLTLKDLKSSGDLKALAAKQKVKTDSSESVSISSVQVPAKTAVYKSQKGATLVVAEMKLPSAARQIASETPLSNLDSTQGPLAGGVKRAQQLKEKK